LCEIKAMKNLPYDEKSQDSILQYALALTDKSLSEVIANKDIVQNLSNKGGFGQILEKYYFYKELDSASQPDFPYAALELKSSPVKKLKTKGELRAKERLVLNIINYNDLVNQSFTTSSFYKKNTQLLLVFYLHEKDVKVLDYVVKLVGIWNFPTEDLKVIEHDWNLIQQKVAAGEAHTLSEGDTFYLGACTKGANARSMREQPNSDIPAKQRAFSLKQGYVNHILAKMSGINDGSFGKIASVPELEDNNLDIEKVVIGKIQPYYGKTPEEISSILGIDFITNAKSRFSILAKALVREILGAGGKTHIEEFEKSDVEIKTIRLSENNLPCEDISFRAFSYEDLIKEEEWQESEFHSFLEKKFLFIFFKYENNTLLLDKALFWNMPYNDRLKAKEVWEHTKELINLGKVVKEITPNNIYKTYFSKKSDHRIVHIRPHARDKNDTFPLPTPDVFTGAQSYMKHSFWLNNSYVRDSIYSLN